MAIKPYDVEGEILVEATADTRIGGRWDGSVFHVLQRLLLQNSQQNRLLR